MNKNEIEFKQKTDEVWFISPGTNIKIEVDYATICEQILNKVRRTASNLITDEYLIDAFMQLTREQDQK